MKLTIVFVVCLCNLSTVACGQYEERVALLYSSLKEDSLTELFAFYHLFPNEQLGQKAFSKGWDLINKHRVDKCEMVNLFEIPSIDIEMVVSLATLQSYQNRQILSNEQLQLIDNISNHLMNRKLKGHMVWSIEETALLKDDEVDVARAILLHQFGPKERNEILSYEASLDMMALQILAKLDENPTYDQMIEKINLFIFHEMHFRFPPHSMWAKDVDLYTFLPSVLDNRHGVCLGVSILYLSLAQRLGLPLEVITPPGHIYLSFNGVEKKINIETTARGIHLEDEVYLGINTKGLKKRSIKEVVGLNFFNAAATAWHKDDYKKAIELYLKANAYIENDPTIHTFLGYNYLFIGDEKKGKEHLEIAKNHIDKEVVYGDTTIEDFLNGNVDANSIRIVYQEVDETRESILKKQNQIKNLLQNFPNFRDGLFHLAITFLQLGRSNEAYEALKQYNKLDQNNPTVEYYLTNIAMQRYEFKEAYKYIRNCEHLLNKANHKPKALTSLQYSLRTTSRQ